MSTESANVIDWQAIVLAWEKSGLSQKAYCQQKAVSYQRFVYERGLLMKRHRLSANHFLAVKKPTERTTLEVPATTPLASPGFVLRCPNGYQLAIPLAADAKTLNQLLSFIGSSEC